MSVPVRACAIEIIETQFVRVAHVGPCRFPVAEQRQPGAALADHSQFDARLAEFPHGSAAGWRFRRSGIKARNGEAREGASHKRSAPHGLHANRFSTLLSNGGYSPP